MVLCTGYEYFFPAYLEPLAHRLAWQDGGFALREDFSIEWEGPEDSRIYVQNAAKHARGVADPNLSLLAWRSAKIINSMMGRRVYDVECDRAFFDWGTSNLSTMVSNP